MEMHKLKALMLLILIAAIAGCGGHRSSSSEPTTGSASFIIEWPDLSRATPTAESIKIVILNGSTVIETQVVDRPVLRDQLILTFGAIPVGDLSATVTAYSQPGALGAPEAQASAPLTILPGNNTCITFLISGAPDYLEITPANPSVLINDTIRLTATPKNAEGKVVLVSPGGISWASMNTAVATVSADGIAAGIAPGTAEITATEGESGTSATVEVTVTGTPWTVMVYMAADNNLEQYALQDMNEFEAVGSARQVPVVVQIDRSPNYDTSNGNWTTTRRYRITKDSDTSAIGSELIEDLGELDMGAPETLAAFVQWATQAYPAEHYLLVLWDHGRGWQARSLAMKQERQVKAIHIDYTSNSEMSLADLTQAFQQIPRPDVVLFDACLMGMVEVAYSIADYAEVMVASEENISIDGQPYSQLLSRITSDPYISPYSLGMAIVDEYIDYYSTEYSGTFTLSAIHLPSINQVISAADGLAHAIMANSDSVGAEVRTAQQSAQRYDYDRGEYRYYKDLYDFSRLVNDLVSNGEVRSAAQNVMTAVDQTVLYERNFGSEVADSHGLSIYLPDPGSVLTEYNLLDFAVDTSWDELVSGY